MFERPSSHLIQRRARQSKSPRRLVPELLENRLLLASYYVDDVLTNGNGTLASPWNTIQQALNTAVAGDTVYIRDGTYRENLQVQAGHFGSAGNYLTLQNYGTEVPVITGSDRVTGWQETSPGSGVWKVSWTTNSQQVFDDGAPLQQIGMPSSNTSIWPTDGSKYTPVGNSLADMAPGRFYYDPVALVLYVQLSDSSSPNNSVMEVSTRRRNLFSDASRGYIKYKGLTFEHTNAAAYTDQDAALTVGSNSIVDSCTFRYTDLAGVSMGLNTSGVQVTNSTFINNGQLGLQGPASYNFTVSNNTVTSNNYRHFNTLWHAGGVKVTTAAYGVIEGNEVGSNYGSGIWFDYANGTSTSTIRNNYIHDNGPTEAGIFFEASKHGVIYNNVLVNNNRRGIYISGSDDAKVYNNTIIGQQGLSAIEVLARNGVNSTNTLVKNNIISGSNSSRDMYLSTGTGNTSDYNNLYRANGVVLYFDGSSKTWTQWQGLGFDLHSTTAAPAFATSTGDSYTLSASSPGRDTGTTLSEVSTDYAGTSRPSGSAYDMGAYEYVGSGGSSDLVAHFAFDEGTGSTTADASGNGNDATLYYSPTWVTPGKVGAAMLSFDGVNDRAQAADSASLDVGSAMSIGGWFYHNSTGGSSTSGIGKTGAYRLTVQSVNQASSQWQFQFTDSGGGSRSVTTTNSYSNDAWHYVMGTYDGATLRIYVDGVEAATPVSYSGTIANSTGTFLMGLRGGTSYYYAGKMDDIRIYNRALSASEVAALAATLDSGRVAHFAMDEGTGSTTADASGNGNNATLYYSPTWVTPGKVGAAMLSFDGVNDRAQAADSASLDVSSAMSIGGWFYHNSTGGSGTSGISKTDAYRLTVQSVNQASSQWQFQFTDSGGGSRYVTTTSSYSNDAWHYVMGTYDGATLRIYVDGVEAATPVSYSGSITNSTGTFLMGLRGGTSYYYAGKMDDIRVYNRALSASEVASLAGGGGGMLMTVQTSITTSSPSTGTSNSLLTADSAEILGKKGKVRVARKLL